MPGLPALHLMPFLLFFFCVLLAPGAQNAGAEGLEGSMPTYLTSINYDEDDGKLTFPSFVTVDPVTDEIYIVDGKSRMIIYSPDFFPLYTLSRKNGIESPQGIAIDDKGYIYIAMPTTKGEPKPRIAVFNPCLKWERDIFFSGFEGAKTFSPLRLAVADNGNLYVAGIPTEGLVILNNQGKFLDMMSPEENDKKVLISDVTITKDKKILLVSEESGRVFVYDEKGKFLFKFGEKGGSSGRLSRPKNVIMDKLGRMYVVDYMRHVVNIYEKDGKFIGEIGGMGWSEGWFQYPTSLAIDSKGRIFVSDMFNDRVQVFDTHE